MKLKGKSAVVTGSSTGIGRSIAIQLAEEGANVVINARGSGSEGTAALDSVVDVIKSNGGTAIAIPGAINDPVIAKKIVKSCVDAFGGIDILVNNAGIYSPEKTTECSPELWQQVIDINLNGAFYLSHFALPHMIKQRWGRIINATSINGTGVRGGSAYAASKSALIGFTRAMAADYGPYGITANVYSPEALTQMGADSDHKQFMDMHRRWQAQGYLNLSNADLAYIEGIAGPSGVSPWITYLCLDEAEYLNGQVFFVESRRVGLQSWPQEQQTLCHDFEKHGKWSLEELQSMAPLAFRVNNNWPRRTGKALKTWENL